MPRKLGKTSGLMSRLRWQDGFFGHFLNSGSAQPEGLPASGHLAHPADTLAFLSTADYLPTDSHGGCHARYEEPCHD
jgi:hypothetical protein